MIDWLKSLPKTLFVALILSMGVLFIVLTNPPRTICDSQLKQFRELTKDFLLIDQSKKNKKNSIFSKLLDTCKSTNSAGGCYELFANLKRSLKDVQTFSPECYPKVQSYSEFSAMVWSSLELMVQMSWGDKAPQTTTEKVGWFDSSDLNLFCHLKKTAKDVYSESRWDSFTAQFFSSLPGASTLSREEAWARMLFSLNCSAYM